MEKEIQMCIFALSVKKQEEIMESDEIAKIYIKINENEYIQISGSYPILIDKIKIERIPIKGRK